MPLTDLSPWVVAGLTWVGLMALLALVCVVVRFLPAPAGDTQLLPRVEAYEGRHRADGWNPTPVYRAPAKFRLAVRECKSIGWRPAWAVDGFTNFLTELTEGTPPCTTST